MKKAFFFISRDWTIILGGALFLLGNCQIARERSETDGYLRKKMDDVPVLLVAGNTIE